MKNILVTGGTVFVSKYIAKYYTSLGDKVHVLNRNHHPQPEGTYLIEADRHHLGEVLKNYFFDVVLDINGYDRQDVSDLIDGLGEFGDYIFISSSAVYPEHLPQPFEETMKVGPNRYWGTYGTDKIEAEQELLKRVPGAYILRPPYLYGPMNNVYREAFVFDCAMQDRNFYLPQDGSMKLQFFHIHDLCKCIDSIVRLHPEDHVFNVGDDQIVSIREWVDACYRVAGKEAHYVSVPESVNPREYFSFYNYQYILDVRRQKELLDAPIPLTEGLKSSYEWYRKHPQDVKKMEYLKYIDEHLAEKVEE